MSDEQPTNKQLTCACETCNGTGTDSDLDEVYEGNCLECNGEGEVPCEPATTSSRPRCERCGQHTDDDGECGRCVNCNVPLCVHDCTDEEWIDMVKIYDTPCSRWLIDARGRLISTPESA